VVLANELCLSGMARRLKAGGDGYLVNKWSAEAFSFSLLFVIKGDKALPSTPACRGDIHWAGTIQPNFAKIAPVRGYASSPDCLSFDLNVITLKST
jgi:hypothetical protein